MDKGYFKKSQYVHLWICLIMRASYCEKELFLDGRVIRIKPGQFVTSRHRIGMDTDIQESKVERILKCFETEQQIEQQSFSKYRIITICNWEQYQQTEQVFEQQMNSKRTASEQQVNTIKKEKKDKKVKKEYIPKISFGENVLLTEIEHQTLIIKYGKDKTEKAITILGNYKLAHGKEYKSDYGAILSWAMEKANTQPGGYDDADQFITRIKTLSNKRPVGSTPGNMAPKDRGVKDDPGAS
jgi:hypothetical protein